MHATYKYFSSAVTYAGGFLASGLGIDPITGPALWAGFGLGAGTRMVQGIGDAIYRNYMWDYQTFDNRGCCCRLGNRACCSTRPRR